MRLKKMLIFVHRWLGVGVCLLCSMWFASGIVMMYWDFPSVTEQDRLERSPDIDMAKVRLSPAEAIAGLKLTQPPMQAKLNTFDGRPVYRFRTGRAERIIYADTGEEQEEVDDAMIQRVAAAWTGEPIAEATKQLMDDVDQWTVQGSLRNLRPLWKFSWPSGNQVYVSGQSGEVVQFTTTSSRMWAYLGPIPHWIYFTPLRKHQEEWSGFVIWSSGISTVVAGLGIVIGSWMYWPRKSVPYQGQKRWHMILGLVFGIAAVTWAFSGMMSMEPFPVDGKRPSLTLRGKLDLVSFGSPPNIQAREIEFVSFNGEPFFLATLRSGETRVVPLHGEARATFDTAAIIDAITKSVKTVSEARVMSDYDSYYLDRRHQKPLPVIFVRLSDSEGTRFYIDPKTARVVGGYNSRGWINRWLYHGLHSLDFLWLYKYRPLWDIVVISFMLGGSALCITSLILASKVVLVVLIRKSV
jgi:hypothetical protein